MDNLSKDDLQILIREVVRQVLDERKTPKRKISAKHYSNQNNYSNSENSIVNNSVEKLIGSIPFILLDKNIFQKNMDVVEFANSLGIVITNGEKKKIDEIVGRVIAAIKEFPLNRVLQLNEAIAQLKSKTASNPKKDKKSFFEEWDRVIKNM